MADDESIKLRQVQLQSEANIVLYLDHTAATRVSQNCHALQQANRRLTGEKHTCPRTYEQANRLRMLTPATYVCSGSMPSMSTGTTNWTLRNYSVH